MTMNISPVKAEFGARITGVKVDELDAAAFLEIKKIWHQRHGLMVFPDQQIAEAGLLKFSRLLGELDPPPNQENGRQYVPGFPEIYEQKQSFQKMLL